MLSFNFAEAICLVVCNCRSFMPQLWESPSSHRCYYILPLDTKVSKQLIEVKQERDNVMVTRATHLNKIKMRPKKKKERKGFQFTSGWDKKLSDLAKTANYRWLRLFSLNVMVISSCKIRWDMRGQEWCIDESNLAKKKENYNK